VFNAYNLQFIQILHVASEVEMFVGSGFSINTNVNDIKLQMSKYIYIYIYITVHNTVALAQRLFSLYNPLHTPTTHFINDQVEVSGHTCILLFT